MQKIINSEIKKMVKSVIPKNDIESVILFGSMARGDFNKNSDYDLLLILKKKLSWEEKKILFDDCFFEYM